MCHTELFLECSWIAFLCCRKVCFGTRPEEGQWVCIYLVMHLTCFHDRLVSTWRSTANPGISWPELSASSPSTVISTMSWRSWQGESPPFHTWGRESVWTGCNSHSKIFKILKKTPNYLVNKWLGKTCGEDSLKHFSGPEAASQELRVPTLSIYFFGGMCVSWLVSRSGWGQGCEGY